jgi:hypothetical protein
MGKRPFLTKIVRQERPGILYLWLFADMLQTIGFEKGSPLGRLSAEYKTKSHEFPPKG